MENEAIHPGPHDPSLLHLQSSHRSTEVWRVGGGDQQRCRKRSPGRLPDDHRMIPLLQSTGFYGVSRICSLQLDWGLISALVERWRPETHTFHLPLGECTITLQDVGILLGLPLDGDPVISNASPGDGMSWKDVIASVFGDVPLDDRFNGARLQLSWIKEIDCKLSNDASEDQLRHHTRCYLLQLIAGSLFTDHSGGLVHCMWIPFLRDLDTCGRYAWGAAVLAFLYRELCKGCKIDKYEVAGCLILLQLWAWERLPTLAPIRTTQLLVDDQFWVGHLPGPRGVRWLVGLSFVEKVGRSVSVNRVILDQLGPSHFIWEPYSSDDIDALPAYCLTGRRIWRYQGPMICIFIVEPHMPERVSRQFGMLQLIPSTPEYSRDLHRLSLQGNTDVNWVVRHQPSINIWNSRLNHIFESDLIDGEGTVPEYFPWYVERTRRFHSRLGGVHVYVGDLLKKITDLSQSVMPEVFDLANKGWNHIQDCSLYGLFEAFPLEERRAKEKDGRQEPGRCLKRGGHGGGRGGVHSKKRQARDEFDQVVPPDEDDYNPTNLDDDHDPLVDDGSYIDGGNFDIPEPPTQVIPDKTIPMQQGTHKQNIQHQPPTYGPRNPILSYPTFDLGLTPTPRHVNEPTQQQPTQQPPPHQPATIRPTQKPILSYPTFDLGITPPSNDGGNPLQATTSPEIPLSQSSEASNQDNAPNSSKADKPLQFYQPRRSKRVPKPTKCGTDGKKCMQPK